MCPDKTCPSRRYLSFSRWLRDRFGEPVRKVMLDAGIRCPHSGSGGCSYCNESSFSPQATRPDVPVTGQLRDGIARAKKRAGKFIAYFQPGTNTNAPPDKLRELFGAAAAFDEVVGLAIGTRPDCIDTAVLDAVEDAAHGKMVWMEVGLQSSNDGTLRTINRGHTFADYAAAARLILGRGFLLCTHVIFGLPGEDRADMLRTVEDIAAVGLDGVKFHQLQILKDTALAGEYRAGTVTTLGVGEYVALLADALELLPADVVVQRLAAEAMNETLIAPRWDVGHGRIVQMLDALLAERDTRQGAGSGC